MDDEKPPLCGRWLSLEEGKILSIERNQDLRKNAVLNHRKRKQAAVKSSTEKGDLTAEITIGYTNRGRNLGGLEVTRR